MQTDIDGNSPDFVIAPPKIRWRKVTNNYLLGNYILTIF